MTDKRPGVYAFMCQFFENNQHPATIGQIAYACNLAPATVRRRLRLLVRAGSVRRTNNRTYSQYIPTGYKVVRNDSQT